MDTQRILTHLCSLRANLRAIENLLLVAQVRNGKDAEYGNDNDISVYDNIYSESVQPLPEGIYWFDPEHKSVSPDSSADYLHVVADNVDVLAAFVAKHQFECIAYQDGKIVDM